jgi:hypothetical protein
MVAYHWEVAAVTPMLPSTASPTEVPTWREALTTPEAAPETPAGTSRMATWAIPGTRTPKPAPAKMYPIAVRTKGVAVPALLRTKMPSAAATQPAATTLEGG